MNSSRIERANFLLFIEVTKLKLQHPSLNNQNKSQCSQETELFKLPRSLAPFIPLHSNVQVLLHNMIILTALILGACL
jgi:hypothetical protein